MAKIEYTLHRDFDTVLKTLERGVLDGSLSATLEDASDFTAGDARCSVRVFERYSWLGKNRVSMNLTLFAENGGPVHLSAITSGGSQAMFFKINTFGEESFLGTLESLIRQKLL